MVLCFFDFHSIFNQAVDRGVANVITWTTIIDAHGIHGHGEQANRLFEEMQEHGVVPNAVTLICILNACSHSQMHTKAWTIYSTMLDNFGFSPTDSHHACMVDAWSRAGMLDKAEQFISNLNNPTAIVWKTLLGASCIHGDSALAQKAAAEVLKLEPNDAATYVVLGNTLANTGNLVESARVWQEMKDKQIKKIPGVTWVTINGRRLFMLTIGTTRIQHPLFPSH